MKKYIYIIGIALLTVGVLPLFSQVSNDNEDEVNKIDTRWAKNDYVPGQVLVKFKDANRVQVNASRGQFRSTSIDRVTQVLQKYGTDGMEQLLPNENPQRKMRRAKAYNGDVIQERDLSQLYLVKLSADHLHETMQMVDELTAIDEVEYAEPNYYAYIMVDDGYIASAYHSNPLVDQQWYLSGYGVKELWDEPIINSERPVIAIIDTGVDTTHPDLKDNCIEGYDFVNNTANVIDDNMHGTHVAGIAAAANNGIGIVGANPRALIMPIKVMDKSGRGNTATILQGVNYAVEHGAKILNLSLGGYGYSKAAADVYRNASLSAIIVAAAGNDGKCIYTSHTGLLKHGNRPEPCFPAAFSFVLGVQAISQNGGLATFSNYDDDGPLFSCESSLDEPEGLNYELKAPGDNILSTIPDGLYKVFQGTSMASPLAAGAISALMMVKKYDNPQELWGDLLHTDNIWQAYQMTERPANLELVRVMMRERKNFTDETEDAYSGYYEAHAGESVDIYPVVRCTLGEASNIKIKLQTADYEDPNAVQILTDEVDFGWHLDAFGKAVSKNPVSVKIPFDVADSRRIQLKLIMTCDEQKEIGSGVFTLIANNIETIHGIIEEDLVLKSGHTYYVDDHLVVNTGVTLTIEPDTRIEFAPGRQLNSNGKMVAKGTKEKPIVFTTHQGNGMWDGLNTYIPTVVHSSSGSFYMNNDTTLFTILQTDLTPIHSMSFARMVYYAEGDNNPEKIFYLDDYMEESTYCYNEELMKDPTFITPAVLRMLDDWKNYCAQYQSKPEGDKTMQARVCIVGPFLSFYDTFMDTLSFCRIENANMDLSKFYPYLQDCILTGGSYCAENLHGIRSVVTDNDGHFIRSGGSSTYISNQRYWNFVNNSNSIFESSYGSHTQPNYSELLECNYFNNPAYLFPYTNGYEMFKGREYWLQTGSIKPDIDHSDYPSYLGTSREDLVRPYIYELGNAPGTYGFIDLSNMPKEPIREAHGIVWKVVVNGKDAQDEFEDLTPLGVGRHKFEVYFNRPMNKAVIPRISFGVRDPWTQNGVDEDGSWNEEGTIYTAYKTITGKTKSDGVNRIYVQGAEDNEFFPCPYEKTRFNINVQAAGSMATGFAAEASLSRVNLMWNNEGNDIKDAMGYNVYRFNDEKIKTIPGRWENGQWVPPCQVPDTIRINDKIVDIETTEYTDYDVEPGHTYYYLYKVLSTDLKEYDISNIVAATPLTATLGDANGSGDVDVADVITIVNYASERHPKPFLFDAADMNSDKIIDILDVIGVINKILQPSAGVRTMALPTATYTVEDGVLYVESPVALAGVQAQVNSQFAVHNSQFAVSADLDGFEQSSAWLTENDYQLLAYSMVGKTLTPGKHALLYIGDADLTSLRLSDTQGHNVPVVAGEGTTKVDAMGSKVMTTKGIYNLNGQKISSDKLRKGVFIVDGKKVVK